MPGCGPAPSMRAARARATPPAATCAWALNSVSLMTRSVQAREHGGVTLPGLGEALHPGAQLLPSRRVRADGPERVVERGHHVTGLAHEGPQEVLLVGEVQVERSV